LKSGIGCVTISTDGKKVAASALDDDHCIVIYDIEKGITGRMNPTKKNSDDGLIATGKSTRNFIFDLKFDLKD